MSKIVRSAFDVMRYEIEHGTQRSVAVLYAIGMVDLCKPENREQLKMVNTAIIERWAVRGLDKVIAIAWKIHGAMTEKAAP